MFVALLNKMKEDFRKRLLDLVYRFLRIRNRTEKEIRDYLEKKIKKNQRAYFSPFFINKIINQLKREGLIDDKKFIDWWVEQRNYFRPKGRILLTQELLAKGVAKETVDRYFEENRQDEFFLAKKALEKKLKLFQQLSPLKRKEKIVNFLRRRGFDYQTIEKIFATKP